MYRLSGIWLLLLLFVQVLAGDGEIARLLNEAHLAKAQFQNQKAVGLFSEVLKRDPNNLEAIYNLGYIHSRIGWQTKDRELKIKHFSLLSDYAKMAYRKFPNSFEANFLMAGGIARMAEFQSPKDRVQAAWDIRKYGLIALRLNPNHPELLHLMSWWNFEIAHATWLERSLADLFYSGLPTDASVDKAIEYLTRALSMRPEYPVYLYDLAIFYEDKGQKQRAMQLLQKAISLSPKAPEDQPYIENSKVFLARLR